MSAPSTHVDEALKLTGEDDVIFYQIDLKNVPNGGVARILFRDGPMGKTTQWNGKTWDHLACQISGIQRTAEEEKSRPTLRLMNPVGIFNDAAFNKRFDGSVLQKFTVLKRHVDNNSPISNNEIWFIGRVKDLITGQSISFELRALSDGPEQLIPARMFIPPEFPFVTL